jgi:type 2 lantibiotic biosynthesis protein LanM
VAKASSLSERLVGGLVFPLASPGEAKLIESRLEDWSQAVAGADAARFHARLEVDGLDLVSARRLLGPASLALDQALPVWADLLREVVELSSDGPESLSLFPLLPSREPEPFAEVLAQFVAVARRRLESLAGPKSWLLSPRARQQLERDLLATLSRRAGRVLFAEFSILRERRQGGFAWIVPPTEGDGPRHLYDEFVAGLRGAGLLDFLVEYAALARLLATTTLFWIESTAELLERLDEDFPGLARRFPSLPPGDRIAGIEPSLSDPHRNGRSVSVLTFTSGRKLVYKPRDLGIEEAFAAFLDWVKERHGPLEFKSPAMLNRKTHGWVEHIEPAPCADLPAGRRFYRRAGGLLCLVYFLGGTDCHFGNVIAHSEYPVFIDLETLLHPFWQAEDWPDATGACRLARERMWDSVLRTRLLPVWEQGKQPGEVFDTGGLIQPGGQTTSCQTTRWRRVNTDGMTLAFEPLQTPAQPNVPALPGAGLGVMECGREVAAGFSETWDFLREHAPELLAAEGPIAAFAGRKARLVARGTEVYGKMLLEGLRPEFLRHGIDRSLKFEALARAVMPPAQTPGLAAPLPRLWPLWVAERQSLEKGDVPYFLSDVDGPGVLLSRHENVPLNRGKSALQTARERLGRLDDEAKQRQVAIILGAFWTRQAGASGTPEPPNLPVNAKTEWDSTAILTAATDLLQLTGRQAIVGPDKSASWIATQVLPGGAGYRHLPLGFGLYDGACGLALSFAAWYHVTGAEEARDLSLAALSRLLKTLAWPESRDLLGRECGLGGCAGVGSLGHTLGAVGRLLGFPALAVEALPLLPTINSENLAKDQVFDLVHGAAGAVMGLLSLHSATGDARFLDKARLCVAHLLAGRTPSRHVLRAWTRNKGAHQIGFSHGAAGIALALLRFYRVTGDPGALDAAKEAIAFERSVHREFNATPPAADGKKPLNAWCHGRTGVALGLLANLDLVDDAETRQEIDSAIQSVVAPGPGALDFVCCGNMGRIELLLTAARVLQRPDLLATARAHAAAITDRAARTGGFTLHPSLPPMLHNPGFFTGTSGVAYMLLRVLHPDRLPAVLLWE